MTALPVVLLLALSADPSAAASTTTGPSHGAKAAEAPKGAKAGPDVEGAYAAGVMLSRNFRGLHLSTAEIEALQRGLGDSLGRKKAVDVDASARKGMAFLDARYAQVLEANKKSSAAFVAKAAARPGAEKTASGLVYEKIAEGTGPSPTKGDTARTKVDGRTWEGAVFDSSEKRGVADAPIARVFPCLGEALQRMKAGGRAKVTCPPALAFGDEGIPPLIPPGAAVELVIELVSFAPTPTPPPGQMPAGHGAMPSGPGGMPPRPAK
jgi:FKBP-type peptidyl-prolyl cis-trans isomerase